MKKFIAFTMFTTLLACSDGSTFKGGISAADVKPDVDNEVEVIPEAPKDKITKTLELTTRSTSAPVDMIWVVDNSGSMKEEVSQVRSNILKFSQSVSERADLRLSFLSNEDKDFGLSIDESSLPKDFLQVKSYVGSNNAMSMLAGALCDKDSMVITDDVVTKICGQDVVSTIANGGVSRSKAGSQAAIENSDLQASVVAGTLKDRVRAGAVRVFVFVTDDTAKGAVTGANFMSVSGSDPATTHAYAFAGLAKKGGCSIANIGDTYSELAKATSGEVFDICEKDWSANFSKLTENVIKLTSNVFEISSDISALKAVKIKGKALTSKQYVFAGGKLIILDKSLLSENETVMIEYEVEEG